MANIVGGGESIVLKLASGLKDILGPEIVERQLVEALAEKRLNEITSVLVITYENLIKLRLEVAKIDKPDDIRYDKDRKPVREEYTKERLDAVQKLRERIDKHEKAITKGITGDIKDAKDLNASQQSSKQDRGSGSGKGENPPPEETN